MLYVDYKIASAVLSSRIKNVLPSIISDKQKGFLKGRFIAENTRLIYDILQMTDEQSRHGLLLLLDFEKAFDSISWEFIKKTLSSFNFGMQFIEWFQKVEL